MKSLSQINDILTAAGVDPADLTKIIADVKAAVTSSFEGVLADKDKQLADKDEAHNATLAKLKDEHASALEKQKAGFKLERIAFRGALGFSIPSETSLPKVDENVLAKIIAEERDDLAGQLAALTTRQDGLAKAAQAFVASLKAITAQGEALSVEAGKSLKDKEDEALAAELELSRQRSAELEAKLAKARGE